MTSPELTLELVVEATGGALRRGDPARALDGVAIDSRGWVGPDDLFVALRGERFDGHDFLPDVSGAAAALIERGRAAPASIPAILEVEDTLAALQDLAGAWRRACGVPVVGITGSNGKTIVKEMLAAIAARERSVWRSPGSYNSQVGVALALLGIHPSHELAILEAGISQVGEMPRLEQMIRPDFGVITNVGLAHAAGLPTLEITAREKLALFAHIPPGGWVLAPARDPSLPEASFPSGPEPVRFDSLPELDRVPPPERHPGCVLFDARPEGAGWRARLRLESGEVLEVSLRAPGEHNLANAACAAAAADRLGLSAAAIRAGLAAYTTSPMRLEIHTTPGGVTLINDAYSADPVSARAALATLAQHAGAQRRVAIFGDMLDLGGRAERAHRELGAHIARAGVHELVCVGELTGHVAEAALEAGMAAGRVHVRPDLEGLHELLEELLEPGDVVLLKASRAVGLERAAARLLESVGPTRLTIDLSALRQNYHAIRRQLGPGARIMAVVKSFGYGNDATRVSMALAREGVEALAVAYPDEAIPLRRAGLELPILVNNTLAEEADKIARYELTALVYTRRQLEALERQAARQGRRVSAHLEIDTGMRRLGVTPERLDAVLDVLDALERIELTGAMTHFAAADDPGQDDFTRAQLAAFVRALDRLAERGHVDLIAHAANTSAAWRFPEARMDMVRIGLGLYGLHPSPQVGQRARQTREALRLSTRIIHLKWIEPGDSVGYGRTWRAGRRTRVATIAAGYNDGLPRFLSNGGPVLVGGQRCPILGNVCMDATMVDVTALGDRVHVGDEVVLFGAQGDAHLPVDELARRGRTISYELLCNISPRVRRIFEDG